MSSGSRRVLLNKHQESQEHSSVWGTFFPWMCKGSFGLQQLSLPSQRAPGGR